MGNLNGSRSTFPGTVDSFLEMTDLSASEKIYAQRWQILKLQASLTPSEQIEFNNLTTQLAPKLFSAETWNKFADCLIQMENFTVSTFKNYYKYIGVYDPSVTYSIYNTCSYNGEIYMALQSTTGNLPTNVTYWLKTGSKGSQGDKGDPGANLVNKGTYNNSLAYNLNELTQYNGTTYYCIQASVGNLPTDTDYWAVFLSPPALPVTSTQELLITTTNLTTVVTHTPTVAKNIQITTYFRVITATTTVSVQITYTDITGSQTLALLTSQSCPTGSYTLLPVFINSTASAITVSITAGTVNQVYASATVLEV